MINTRRALPLRRLRNALFDSRSEFDSGTGWPSFWEAKRRRKCPPEKDFSAGVLRPKLMHALRRAFGTRLHGWARADRACYCMNRLHFSLSSEKAACHKIPWERIRSDSRMLTRSEVHSLCASETDLDLRCLGRGMPAITTVEEGRERSGPRSGCVGSALLLVSLKTFLVSARSSSRRNADEAPSSRSLPVAHAISRRRIGTCATGRET